MSRSSSAVHDAEPRRRRRASSEMPWCAARSRTSASAVLERVGAANVASSSSIRPASTLDRSRISLSSASRCRPESRMSRRYSSWRSLSSPNIRSSSTSENPITALSGVRSSCDMLARNSDLCWLAISSCAALTSSSRKRRALWMATADWLASVSSRSQVSGAERAGRLCAARPARRRSRPRAGAGRRPASATRRRRSTSRWASSGSSVEVRDLQRLTARGGAADERLVDVDPQRARASRRAPRSCRRRSAPGTAASAASNSMIEPPSVSDSCDRAG